ncbi:MAG: cupin domain-containing protein [Acidimicrobiia bacterium]
MTEKPVSADGPLAPVDLEPIGDCTVLRDVTAQPGVDTVEGTLVPLLTGAAIRSHMIVMYPGQYCDAHPHDSESIIFTISGRWVFATTEDGKPARTVINQGDLFHFPAGVPTAFETPFDEAAVILILKGGGSSYGEMAASMVDARDTLAAEAASGIPFAYRDLPGDHPGRVYATEVAGRDPAGSEQA